MEWYEHIRLNPEKYVGKIGDGSSPDDGIYTLLKGLIDCSVDEYEMGRGFKCEMQLDCQSVLMF